MKIALWGTGSSASSAVVARGTDAEIVQVIVTSPEPGQQFLGNQVMSPQDLDKSVDEVWICSMFYPEILQTLLGLGMPIGRVRIFEDHLSTPGVAVNEVDPLPVLQRMDDYRQLREVRSAAERLVEFAPEFASRWDFLRFALKSAPSGGLRIELGVFEGESLIFLQGESTEPVWGIDSLAGFDADSSATLGVKRQEAGMHFFPIEQNEFFIRGRFQDALPSLLEGRSEVSFVHYDASDISAVRFAFAVLEERFASGAVVVFDDFIPHPHDLDAPEFTAYVEYLARTDSGPDVIARWASAVAVRVNPSGQR